MIKKISTIAISGLLFAMTACDTDINENPNYPSGEDVSSDLILPAAENFIADCVGDQMFNYAGFFAQYFEQMPSANQYNDEAELNINESKDLFNRCYTYLYAGALEDLDELLKNRVISSADAFACTVLRAYCFQLLVDNFSDAPYTEALQGAANTMPHWDNGETIYNGVLNEMAEAEKNIQGYMTLTDPLLNNDVEQWRGFANALRLRMLLRLIDGGINASANTELAKDLVSKNKFFTGNITWDVYTDTKGQYNPWYAGFSRLNAKNHCAAYPIISYMTATQDARIAYAIKPRAMDDTYFGQMPGAKTVEAGWLGLTAATYNDKAVSNIDYDIMIDAPIYLFTQAELQFLIAEVQLRFFDNDDAAKAAYEAGIAADFANRGIDMGGFLNGTTVSWSGSDTNKLYKIYMQKWVALFMRDHMEAWTEARRTDVPALSTMSGKDIQANPSGYRAGDFIEPSINYILAGGLAKRVPYPSNARRYNDNVPAAKLLSDRVFWDAK